MSSTVRLSDILWLAANEKLGERSGFSCDAVQEVIIDLELSVREEQRMLNRAERFLDSLGCDTYGIYAFSEFPPGPERQGARYAWLVFASMYAKELDL